MLTNGDIIVMDNCATHHNAGGLVLGRWLNTMGIDVVHLPTYSPDLNPVELVFNKLKIVFKREEMQSAVRVNLHAAIYNAFEEITENDLLGFYRCTEYIFV